MQSLEKAVGWSWSPLPVYSGRELKRFCKKKNILETPLGWAIVMDLPLNMGFNDFIIANVYWLQLHDKEKKNNIGTINSANNY